MEFLNFLLDPEIAAMNTKEVYCSPPVSMVKEYLPPETANDPELFLPKDILAKAQHYRIISDDNLRLRKRMLDTLKNGMKLNNRLPFLIIPVLFTSFLLIAVGLYFIERKATYSLTRSSVAKEAAELSGSLTGYTHFASGTLATIIQSDSLRRYTATSDEYLQTLAFDSSIDEIINSAEDLPTQYFSVMFFSADGSVKYYYETGLDPFSEAPAELKEWASKLFIDKKQADKHYFVQSGRVAVARVLNQTTLKPAFDFSNQKNFAVTVCISPTNFEERRQELRQAGRTVTLDSSNWHPDISTPLSALREIPGYGLLRVEADHKGVEKNLKNILFKLTLLFLLLTVITHLVLQWLMKKYVTGPIEQLEYQFSHIDLDQRNEISVYRSNDEIGSLNASFVKLYEKFRETYEKTKELAEKDSLTKLYNRRVFNLTLDQLINRAGKSGVTQVALLYIDIDNFKYINDNYGHAAGDVVLQSFALRLHEIIRGSDVIFDKIREKLTTARLAGDEFSVIIHGYSGEDVPRKVAERILKTCENGFSCEGEVFPITLSIGVAIFPEDGSSAEELVVNADSAMYESKKNGKNSISYYSAELSEYARRQQLLEIELKQLDLNELVLYYMPIVDVKKGRIKGFEALLRWFSKNLGAVSPNDFIPLAETLGLHQRIDMWVLEQALDQAHVIWDHFGDDMKMSINISAAELSNVHFTDELLLLVERKQVKPQLINIEITETFYRDRSSTGLDQMIKIKEAGFNLAIDDFGSGFTSIIQLVEFPIDIVKIDRLFLMKAIDSGKQDLIGSLVRFCHDQNLLVTAEGVETPENLKKLTDAGCDSVQGFHFGTPMPLDQLVTEYKNSRLN